MVTNAVASPVGPRPSTRVRSGRAARPVRWSLARQFMVAHFAIVLLGVLVTGAWIGNQIESSVLDRSGAFAALYVDSVISPRLQSLAQAQWLSADEIAGLDRLITGTALGQGVVVFKVWSPDRHVLYSPDRALIGHQFPVNTGFLKSVAGEVTVDMSDLSEPENEHEATRWSHLIEVYAPVRRDLDGQIIAINEFYLLPDQLETEIRDARLRAWLMVGGLGAMLYVLTSGIVKRGSDTIQRQRARLEKQVVELALLHQRVLHAASRNTALNEQTLRRISADLHDGPAQVLALAMLRLDALRTPCGDHEEFSVVHEALRESLAELRTISSELRLPELEQVTVPDILARAIGDHERRSGTPVNRQIDQLPENAPLAVKIALMRTLQEALSNASRHGAGTDVAVRAWSEAGELCLEVADRGPGFDPATVATTESGHLGLAGMRERAELLGGHFAVRSAPGAGTIVRAGWPLMERSER